MFSVKYCDNHSFKLPLIQKQVKVICMSIFATYYLGFKVWKEQSEHLGGGGYHFYECSVMGKWKTAKTEGIRQDNWVSLEHQLQNIYTKAEKRIHCNKEKCPRSLLVPIVEPQGILLKK